MCLMDQELGKAGLVVPSSLWCPHCSFTASKADEVKLRRRQDLEPLFKASFYLLATHLPFKAFRCLLFHRGLKSVLHRLLQYGVT